MWQWSFIQIICSIMCILFNPLEYFFAFVHNDTHTCISVCAVSMRMLKEQLMKWEAAIIVGELRREGGGKISWGSEGDSPMDGEDNFGYVEQVVSTNIIFYLNLLFKLRIIWKSDRQYLLNCITILTAS